MTRQLVVWIDDWQWQCCGEPFQVGSEVDWTMSDQPDRDWLVPVLGAELAGSLTHAEDHHGGLENSHAGIAATVQRIRAVSSEYGPNPDLPHENAISPIPGTGLIEDVAEGTGHHKPGGGRRFVGYVVDLVAE
ncbi:hypothetical protein ABIE44_000160 [Marmoricola sp. OAE513]|uniref:DUF6578 domain-containing protein n=1 Tax=Marmoricola sp. OAE513 TaxID=2817894 RepID=UPI001AEB45D9